MTNIRRIAILSSYGVGAALLWLAWSESSQRSACLGVVAACVGWSLTNSRGRVVAFNLGALALVAFAYLSFREPVELWQEFSHREGVFVRDPVLGHRPAPNLHTRARGYGNGILVYDVEYDVDEHGLRVGPPEDPSAPAACILFFGGSYTYGEGVENEETMPYRVGVALEGRYRVRNFAYSGYGPHHMLAQIESGFVERNARCQPEIAVLQVIPHHALRISGKWAWDEFGPRYVLAEGGRVERVGNLGQIDETDDQTRDATAADIRLLHGIVLRSRDLLEARFPGIEFHVLHWDVGPPPLFRDGWWDERIVVHRLSRLLPFGDWFWRWKILMPLDGHPRPATHARIAQYVVDQIIDGREQGSAHAD